MKKLRIKNDSKILVNSAIESSKGEESPPEQMINDVLLQPLDSDGSNETDKDIPRQCQPQNKLREDLQKSFPKLDKSIKTRGLESSNIVHESLWWDHENMQDDHRPPCTYVSEGEEDQELLENLEALDPCGEYDQQPLRRQEPDQRPSQGQLSTQMTAEITQ